MVKNTENKLDNLPFCVIEDIAKHLTIVEYWILKCTSVRLALPFPARLTLESYEISYRLHSSICTKLINPELHLLRDLDKVRLCQFVQIISPELLERIVLHQQLPYDQNIYDLMLMKAVKFGLSNVVEYLLQHMKTLNSEVVKVASELGHLDSLSMLLEDKRINPVIDNNYAVRYASSNGHFECLKLLMSHSRIQISNADFEAMIFAAANGHEKCVEYLLKDGRIDDGHYLNVSLRFAASNGQEGCLKLLLADARCDPNDLNCIALSQAAESGHIGCLQLLLSNSRVDPSLNNDAILRATNFRQLECVRILIEDGRAKQE
ncbi:ankyrin repeat-containing domain protein [Globomyces pollinis-pini]|nr:ankyrin repeat-containing domain protein [Globomyces pollinis-pini]